VENVAFDDPLPTAPEPPGFLTRYERPLLDGGRTVAILAIGVVGLFFLKSMVGRTLASVKTETAVVRAPRNAAMPAADVPRTVAELESEMDALDAGSDRRLPALTRRVAGLAQKEPATTAKLLRSWMVEGS
jgi:flagellar biosynthesis/type III secretory pathway M-ring protein FliF/YscJ